MQNVMLHSVGELCNSLLCIGITNSGAASISVRGDTFGGRPCRGSEDRAPPPPPPGAWEFSKICKEFKKLAKMHYFSPFFKKLLKSLCNFSLVWAKNPNFREICEKSLKIYDQNSIEKLNCKLFLEMLLLKIEPLEITSFIYIIFPFRGGERSLCFPLAAPMQLFCL